MKLQKVNEIRMGKISALFVVAVVCMASAMYAEEGVYWSDTPVTCHWIGAVRRASTSGSGLKTKIRYTSLTIRPMEMRRNSR